ncbi:MAG: exonuclease SbcCD subunit D [Deferribacteres bacterium]|nr:exonuclease SbcCD subunit D [candidate division KSB1 bacterium]MCB9512542.1 exonuclease SbcCD subunit D [Deferribacteres bacterium]
MRFVHFSDTHLGFSDLNKIDATTGINQRESDFYRAWWQAIDKILELKPDFVVHAGDLFQTPRPNNRAIRVGLEGIQRLNDADIPFVVVAGNHSTPRIRQTGSIFESIALFPKVHAAYQSKYERFRVGECALHCVPHCSLSDELSAAYQAVERDADAKYQLFVTHGAWRESDGDLIGSVGEFNEQYIENPAKKLNIAFDYIALGHYHKYLRVAENAYYSGSTERTSFNEVGYSSGLILVDLAQKTHEYVEIQSRPMLSIGPLDCAQLTCESIYEMLEKKQDAVSEGCMLRLELKGLARDTLLLLDLQRIDAIFPQALHIEKIFHPNEENDLHRTTASIGSLPTEFERYLEMQKDFTLDREKFRSMGLSLLDLAEQNEPLE